VTLRYTAHALERIDQMALSRSTVERVALDPDLEYPGNPRRIPDARCAVRDGIVVVWVPDHYDPAAKCVVTVLWDKAEGRDEMGAPA